MYEIKLITKELQRTSIWSGGKTTEIAIYPPESQYSQRDFLWRLSSALVEAEESTFTKLPGYDRHLMVLAGGLRIVHNGQHTSTLNQYDKDFFKGAWDTVSFGKARDFNLMVREGAEGSLQHVSLQEAQQVEVKLAAKSAKKCFFGCYCIDGHASIDMNGEAVYVKEGELLLLNYSDCPTLHVQNKQQSGCSLIFLFIEV